MAMEIFVHPGHVEKSYSGFSNEQVAEQFTQDLISRISTSDNPVLISGLNDSKFLDYFNEQNIFRSDSFSLHDGITFDYGHVCQGDFGRFSEFLTSNKNEKFRVNGCNVGECLDGFVIQSFNLIQNGKNFNFNSKKDMKKLKRYESRGYFRKSNFKYGSVLGPAKEKIKNPLPLFRPWGNVAFQLVDESTRIYGA